MGDQANPEDVAPEVTVADLDKYYETARTAVEKTLEKAEWLVDYSKSTASEEGDRALKKLQDTELPRAHVFYLNLIEAHENIYSEALDKMIIAATGRAELVTIKKPLEGVWSFTTHHAAAVAVPKYFKSLIDDPGMQQTQLVPSSRWGLGSFAPRVRHTGGMIIKWSVIPGFDPDAFFAQLRIEHSSARSSISASVRAQRNRSRSLIPPDSTHGPDFRSVRWKGRLHNLTASNAAVVAILWAQAENGTPDVGWTYLQDTCHLDTERWKDALRENLELVGPGERKGTIRLKI